MDRYYSFAGLTFLFKSEKELESNGYSELFRVNEKAPDVTLTVTLCQNYRNGKTLIENDLFRIIEHNGIELIQFFDQEKNRICFELEKNGDLFSGFTTEYDFERIGDMYYMWRFTDLGNTVLNKNRLLLHCSFIIVNNSAVLFCGKSGIGKSTQAELWNKHLDAEIINGDKAMLYLKDDKVFACSLPIAGTSGICVNREAPVKAIISLGQGKINIAKRLNGTEALSALISSTLFDGHREGATEKALMLCSKIVQGCEIISYSCLPDESSVLHLNSFLEG